METLLRQISRSRSNCVNKMIICAIITSDSGVSWNGFGRGIRLFCYGCIENIFRHDMVGNFCLKYPRAKKFGTPSTLFSPLPCVHQPDSRRISCWFWLPRLNLKLWFLHRISFLFLLWWLLLLFSILGMNEFCANICMVMFIWLDNVVHTY